MVKTRIEKDGLEDFVPYLMNRITQRYNQMQMDDLRELGLSVSKMRALTSLAVKGPLTINELCVHSVVEQPTMSRTVDAMEQEGLVKREVSEEDQRVRMVSLTTEGREMFERFWPAMDRTSDTLSEVLSPDEKLLMLDMLKRIMRHIRVNPY